MLNKSALLAAVATVSLGFAGTSFAQTSDTVTVRTDEKVIVQDRVISHDNINRTGSTDSLGVVQNTARSSNELKQPAVWKGARAQGEKLNVGHSLPERTAFGRVGDIDNSNTGTMNHLPSGELTIEREAIVASDTTTYTPAPAAQPMVTEETTVSNDGLDHRFLKPADPAVVTPDYKMNAGIDRTLAQDKNVYGRSYRMNEYRATDDSVALRDISNNPIDSQNDPRFKNPALPADTTWNRAEVASERIEPDTYVAPAQPAVVPVPVVPAKPSEYQSTWSSESDRLANDDNAVRPYRYPDKDQPAPMKGERANNALDNTRNPVPDKTIFGKTGEIRSNGPVNNAGEPLVRPVNP